MYVVDLFHTRDSAATDFQVALAIFEAELAGLSMPLGTISIGEVFAVHPSDLRAALGNHAYSWGLTPIQKGGSLPF